MSSGCVLSLPLLIDHEQMLLHFLPTLKPCGHLRILVPLVSGPICVLGKVNMEAFGMLGIVIVSGAKKGN